MSVSCYQLSITLAELAELAQLALLVFVGLKRANFVLITLTVYFVTTS